MSARRDPLAVRPQVLGGLLVCLSGGAALTHQLLWTRRLIDLLGASGESSARVFGAFFLGLSAGSAVAAILAGRVRSPLVVAGLAQLAIAPLVLPMVLLPSLTDWVWPAIGPENLVGWIGSALKAGIALAAIFAPALLMGLSFPLVVEGILRRSGGALGRSGIRLYAVNTLGGALGLVLAVGWVVPRLGIVDGMIGAATVDAGVGIALLWMAGKYAPLDESGRDGRQAAGIAATHAKSPSGALLWVAFFSGAAVLALEVSALRMFMLVATLSIFAPAAILVAVITALAAAAGAYPAIASRCGQEPAKRVAVGALAAAGVLTAIAPIAFMVIARQSNWFAENASSNTFVLKLVALALVTVGPAWFAGGLVFPAAVAWSGVHTPASHAGRRLGLLLAVNGFGGLLGAELAYRILLPQFGIYGSISVIAIGMTLAGFTLWATGPARRIQTGVVVAIAGLLVLITSWNFTIRLPVMNPPAGVSALDIRTGREGTVAVVEDQRDHRSIIVSNQYSLGGTSVRYDQERQLLLPLVLHESPREVACIGLATGITAGAGLGFPTVDHVTAVEISPLVARAADEYFSDFNYGICRNDRASVVVGDGRTYIASATGRFDVITGDLFLPWAPGTARLYSREHFASVRRALRPGGVFCQWLPMYQLTPGQFEVVANTFAAEFPYNHLFMNHLRTRSPMLGLVARKTPGRESIDWDQIGARCDALRSQGGLHDPILRHRSGLRMLYLGRWNREPMAASQLTLDNPFLEYSAATVRLSERPQSRYFHPARWIRFCRTRHQRVAGDRLFRTELPEGLGALACGFLELDFARRREHRLAKSISRRIAMNLPTPLRDDREADWQRWPGAAVATMPTAEDASRLNRP